MSVAVFSLIIIAIWVYSELSFDKFHNNYKNIFLVTYRQNHSASMEPASQDFEAPLLKAQFPEVLNFVRFQYVPEVVIQKSVDNYFTLNGAAVDSTLFDVFTIDLIRGNKNQVLRRPDDILISESLASKYFGNSDPMAKPLTTIKINKRIYFVAGVFHDLPSNSTLQFDFLIPNDRYGKDWWDLENSFIVIRNVKELESVKKKMIYSCRQSYSPESEISLFPLADIYFHSNFKLFGRIQYGSLNYVKIFSAVALFILLLASFNVINLITSKIDKRSKEIALKKILGSGSALLYKQFLLESLVFSILVCFAATILAVITMSKFDLLPGLNRIQPGVHITIYVITGSLFIIWITTGLYPAALFSNINPLSAIKGKTSISAITVKIRKSLVSFQYIISVFLLISCFWVIGQIRFLRNADLGFSPENVVIIPCFYHFSQLNQDFKNMADQEKGAYFQNMRSLGSLVESEFKKTPIIEGYTYGEQIDQLIEYKLTLKGSNPISNLTYGMVMGQDFEKVLKIKILNGRAFTDGNQFDECLINEAALKAFNLTDPIGSILQNSYGNSFKVVGVTNNFQIQHISTNVRPLVIFKGSNNSPMMIKIKKDHLHEGLKLIKQLYDYKRSDIPFTYKLLEDEINRKYANDYRACWILIFFSIIALIISCMGIYGLAGFQAQSRTREIAVRKVFGAHVRDMHLLFLLEFGRHVLISLIIGCPLAYYGLKEFASNFELHPSITFWPFLLSALIMGFITLFTVESQIVLVCRKNAAETLKYE